MDGNKLVAQIDMGVPLTDLMEDLPYLLEGNPGTSKTKYEIRAADPEAFNAFVKRSLEEWKRRT